MTQNKITVRRKLNGTFRTMKLCLLMLESTFYAFFSFIPANLENLYKNGKAERITLENV